MPSIGPTPRTGNWFRSLGAASVRDRLTELREGCFTAASPWRRALLPLRRRRKGVNHLAGPGIAQFLARLVLDGVGIRLQVLDAVAKLGVFLLQCLDFLLVLPLLDALFLPG